jgi:hypothetical protein
MRKRSAYKPRPRIANPMAYVMESVSLVAGHTTFIRDLHIRNHLAMTSLTQGRATKSDIDLLIAMNNVVEALWRLGYGKGYEEVLKQGSAALLAVARRGAESGRFVLKSGEMNALNTLMDLHDAQMDAITIGDLEKAIAIVRDDTKARRAVEVVVRDINQAHSIGSEA